MGSLNRHEYAEGKLSGFCELNSATFLHLQRYLTDTWTLRILMNSLKYFFEWDVAESRASMNTKPGALIKESLKITGFVFSLTFSRTSKKATGNQEQFLDLIYRLN